MKDLNKTFTEGQNKQVRNTVRRYSTFAKASAFDRNSRLRPTMSVDKGRYIAGSTVGDPVKRESQTSRSDKH
jgi:hypothetical protein